MVTAAGPTRRKQLETKLDCQELDAKSLKTRSTDGHITMVCFKKLENFLKNQIFSTSKKDWFL